MKLLVVVLVIINLFLLVADDKRRDRKTYFEGMARHHALTN